MNIREYPGFPEYKLVDIYPNKKIYYRRGNEMKNFFEEDFLKWQDYFCNIYSPPKNKKIALFHCCSWSKPYDFSYIIFPIKILADKYPGIHRIILSNVGVVPYEYQMNESFCTYDFPPIYDTAGMDKEQINELRMETLRILYDRVYNYLSNHRNCYKKVLSYSSPIKYGMGHIIALACSELELEFEYVLNIELYKKYSKKNYFDICEIYKEPEVLHTLEECLKRNVE